MPRVGRGAAPPAESGFDQLPAERRAEAYRGNTSGWAQQMDNIARHVGGGA